MGLSKVSVTYNGSAKANMEINRCNLNWNCATAD
jgi:hypothetical protein